MKNKILVTGGAGYIGSTMVPILLKEGYQVTVLDSLIFNQSVLLDVCNNKHFEFIQGDICDKNTVKLNLKYYNPDAIVHFAAESHVDRSIEGPFEFLQTNIMGTAVLLDGVLHYYKSLN